MTENCVYCAHHFHTNEHFYNLTSSLGNAANSGYGSPSQPADTGYGSPSQPANTGYGSPAAETPANNYAAPAPAPSYSGATPAADSYGAPLADPVQSYDAPSSGYDKPPTPSGKPSITYTVDCLRRGLDLGWARTNPCWNIQDMVSGLMNNALTKDSLLIGVSHKCGFTAKIIVNLYYL